MGASTDGDTVEILRGLDRDFAARAKAGDARLLVEGFYADDACVMPPQREVVRGHRAVMQLWKGVIAAGLKDLALDTTHIEVCGDMAYGMGRYRMVVEPPGGPRSEQTGKYLVVYRKRPDSTWRAVADMFDANG
jgi:ketosteroid isomerase-like protein